MTELCSYCGKLPATTRDHVVPKAIYPAERLALGPQLVTVPCCLSCNQAWSDDEVQFRNIIAACGPATQSVMDLWRSRIRPSFDNADGRRRFREWFDELRPIETDVGTRHEVYPAKDPRTVRILKKIIRGLSHHHGLGSAIPEDLVDVKVNVWRIPDEVVDSFEYRSIETDIFFYGYIPINDEQFQSLWNMTFLGRTPFLGAILQPKSDLIQQGAKP